MSGVSVDLTRFLDELHKGAGDEFDQRMMLAIERAIKRTGGKSVKLLQERVEYWTDEIKFELVPNIDFENKTASFEVVLVDDEPDTIKPSGADIFRFIDEGTEPHDIPLEPKLHGDPLGFKIPDVGLIYAQQVHGNYIQSKNWTQAAVDSLELEFPAVVELELSREFDKIEAEGYGRPTRDE